METLSERFTALQEKLMDIYESGLETLEAQIEHWQLLRQEQVLLNFARRNGVLRLGYQPVPSLATSETKAKDAIGMVLLLQSLQTSKYAEETWSLVQTSLETVRSPPENCFKKEPQTIEVVFDGDPENRMIYTVWNWIYFQNTEDIWQKVKGQVDYEGAFYMEGTHKHYYLKFENDANRFSTTGLWEVHVNQDTVFTPVTSSTPQAGSKLSPLPSDSTSRQSVPSTSTATSTKQRRYGRKRSSPTATTTRRQRQRTRETQQKTKRLRSRTRSRTRSRSRSRSSGRQETDYVRGRGQGGRGRERERERGRADSSNRTSQGGGRSGRRPQTRSRSRSGGSPNRVGVAPSEVGTTLHSVGTTGHGRLGRLLDEAKDPPVILLRGEANQLKCYRYRARKKHKGNYKYFSSTWSWIGEHSNDRIGRARMLVTFISTHQRELFLDTMKLPQGVDWSYGNFDSL